MRRLPARLDRCLAMAALATAALATAALAAGATPLRGRLVLFGERH